MNIRRIVSLTASLSFVLMVLTSIVCTSFPGAALPIGRTGGSGGSPKPIGATSTSTWGCCFWSPWPSTSITIGLNSTLILRGLNGKGITTSAEATLKEIASQHQTSPMDLYEILKTIAAAGVG